MGREIVRVYIYILNRLLDILSSICGRSARSLNKFFSASRIAASGGAALRECGSAGGG